MRIAELSRRSGTSIPTIKYYLREGLLPPGTSTGRNQAEYDERHLGRLRLIRALREVGGLSVAATRQVLATLDEPVRSTHELMGHAHQAVIRPLTGSRSSDTDDPAWRSARQEAGRWITSLGWRVHPDNPALDRLADGGQVDPTDGQLPGVLHHGAPALTRAGPTHHRHLPRGRLRRVR